MIFILKILRLLRKIKEDQTKYRDTSYVLIGIFNIIKMSDAPRFSYRFSAIPIRIPAFFSNRQTDKFSWKAKERKKNKAGGLVL